MKVVLAIDLGGSGLKAGLVSASAQLLATERVGRSIPLEPDGRSQVDPDVWWSDLGEAAQRLAASRPDLYASVAAVAICGMTRTQVVVDEEGAAVCPAVTWRDASAPPCSIDGRVLDAFHPIPRLLRLRREEPETMARAAAVLDPKDYLAAHLTGMLASDAVSLARLIDDAGLVPEAAWLRGLLPPLLAPTTEVGLVRRNLPGALGELAGRPVFMSSHDTWAAVLGLGALRVGEAYAVSGTSEVLGLIAGGPAVAEGLIHVVWGQGLHHLGGPSQTGASAIDWLAGITGVREGSLDSLLAGPRHSRPLLFLPFLEGERVPYWDPALRGAFLGLDRGHGTADLAAAVVEGVAFANRVVLERAEGAAGLRAPALRLGGGVAASRRWAQAKADICARPVLIGAQAEPGLLGAGLVAWTGLGHYASLAAAQDAVTGQAQMIEPRPEAHDTYERLFALHKDAVAAMRDLSHRLAFVSNPSF